MVTRATSRQGNKVTRGRTPATIALLTVGRGTAVVYLSLPPRRCAICSQSQRPVAISSLVPHPHQTQMMQSCNRCTSLAGVHESRSGTDSPDVRRTFDGANRGGNLTCRAIGEFSWGDLALAPPMAHSLGAAALAAVGSLKPRCYGLRFAPAPSRPWMMRASPAAPDPDKYRSHPAPLRRWVSASQSRRAR